MILLSLKVRLNANRFITLSGVMIFYKCESEMKQLFEVLFRSSASYL